MFSIAIARSTAYHLGLTLMKVGLNDSDKVESWSIVADVAMPMTDTFSHKAQIFWGRNLDDYLGG